MSLPLLVEIGVEELPAIPFLKELPNIETKWNKILQEYALECDFEFFYTPRRLVLWHPEFPTKQPDSFEEFFGAPEEIAFKDGEPTKAALGFAKKVGVPLEEIGRIERKGQKVLYYKKEIPGRPAKEVLPQMVESWLKSLNFGKAMRWGSLHEEFIRPIRWGIINLGHEFIEARFFGITTGDTTRVHRSVTMEPVRIEDAKDYFHKLDEGGVVLSQDERAKRIEVGFERIEREGVFIERDLELFGEVVAITEYPTPLLGKFDEAFLELPQEVLITSMKEHQRYFPVFDQKGLDNSFVVVSNAYTQDFAQIVKGNERVLRARFNDAMFFYRNDLDRGLDFEGLKEIVFMDGLGSMFDKELRELFVAQELFEEYKDRISAEVGRSAGELKALLERAVMLSKADLLTEMVYEFPELQGIMGYYYALAQGEDELVALAIKEQYLPKGEESDLPSNLLSALVAMAVKIDTLMALFSVGKIPTGSKDPFGLRRAAIGIIRIAIQKELPFDISSWDRFAKEYEAFDIKELERFFIERLYQYFDLNPSLIKAVIESGERDLVRIAKKVEALTSIVGSDDFKEVFTTFKRVANIVKDMDLSGDLDVEEALFEKEEEADLWHRFNEVRSNSYPDYESRLKALFGLKPLIDRFFDNVLVNAEDERLRTNRKNLIASIYKEFRNIADIKEISI